MPEEQKRVALDDEQLTGIKGGINWITFSKGIINSIDPEDPGKYAEYVELVKRKRYIESSAIALQLILDGDPLFTQIYKELL